MRTGMSRSTFAKFIKSSLESGSQFLNRSSAPIVKENHERSISHHMMMNSDHVESVLTKSFQNQHHFLFEHRHVTRNRRVFLRANKHSPHIQSHTSIDNSSILLHSQIIASHNDFV